MILFTLILFAVAEPQTEIKKSFTIENEAISSSLDLENQAENLANQWNGSAVRRSIEIFDFLSEKYRNQNDFKKAAETLLKSARLSLLLEKFDVAEAKLGKISEINKKLNDENLLGEILSLHSNISLKKGKIPESENFINQALMLNLPDGEAKGAILSANAEVKYTQHNLNETIGNGLKALEIWRKNENVKEEIKMLSLLGYAYISDEKLQESRQIIEEAIETSRRNNLRREEALAQLQMGWYYMVTNEPQKSLEICRHIESLFPDDMDFIEKAQLFNGIGSIYEVYADWKSALIYRHKALDLYEKGKYPTGKLASMSSLVNLNFLINEENKAFEFFKQTGKLSAKLKDKFYIAYTNMFVGDHFNKTGKSDEAIDFYSKALNSFKALNFIKEVNKVENNLGKAYLRQKEFEIAEIHFQSALEISRKIRDKISESETLFNLSKLRYEQNNTVEALNFVEQSVEITENLSAGMVNAKLKTAYFSNVFQRYELYIKLLMELNTKYPEKNYAAKAFQISEKSRARQMLEYLTLSGSDFTKDAPKELVEQEKEIRNLLNVKSNNLSDLLNLNENKTKITETENEIRQLENQLEEILARLKRESPVYSAVKNPAPFEIAEFQKNILDENTVLLEFSLGDDVSYLWKIGKNEFSSFVLPPREQIETKVRILRELLEKNELGENETIENFQARIAESEIKYQKTANDLSRELFGQTINEFAGKRLIIVADGYLNYFPVSALPFPNSSDDRPILLTNEVIYEPSASLLTMLRTNASNQNNPPKDLLLFADPVFSRNDSRFFENEMVAENSHPENSGKFRFTGSLDSLSRLRASKDEAVSILNTVGTEQSTEFSGFDASRENFSHTNISDYKILHFATHGLINEERPELSGIILSRFDRNGNKINESIRLQDIYELNLKSDLVVLSACNTGIGKNIKGEGLMSLNNAFLQSGSKTVISSLWKVEDYAAVELMNNFYRKMSDENVSPSVALRAAQIKMWENPQYKSPFYWAAFTIHGDFQVKPEFSNSRNYYKYYILPSVLFLLVLLLGSYGIYKKVYRQSIEKL